MRVGLSQFFGPARSTPSASAAVIGFMNSWKASIESWWTSVSSLRLVSEVSGRMRPLIDLDRGSRNQRIGSETRGSAAETGSSGGSASLWGCESIGSDSEPAEGGGCT